MKTIATLITCHNRREKTLACLEALFGNTLPDGCVLTVFLVDDGSSDGTTLAVNERFPDVVILQGDGNLYWNRGMHLAFAEALKIGFDAYLWLNDDTFLTCDALSQLQQTFYTAESTMLIVVGAVRDSKSSVCTYGGWRLVSPFFRPFLSELIEPNGSRQEIDVFNGNVVLIPGLVADALGNLDWTFEHGMGDTDYGLRARKSKIKIFLTSEYVGCCDLNEASGTYHDKSLSLGKRFRQAISRKGLPWRGWLLMCWRHGGIFWFVHFFWGYLKLLFRR